MIVLERAKARAATSQASQVGRKDPRQQMALLMLLADLLGFACSFVLALVVNHTVQFFHFQISDIEYAIIPFICILFFINSKLYPGVGINPADEIRLVAQMVTFGFFIGMIVHLAIMGRWDVNVLPIVVTGLFSILFVLLVRWATRITAVQLGLWGEAVAVIADASKVERLAQYFLLRRRLGFVPALAVTGTKADSAAAGDIPMVSLQELLEAGHLPDGHIQTALVDLAALSTLLNDAVTRDLGRLFPHIIFISDMTWLEGATLNAHDFEGLVGIEARKNVLNPFAIVLKRLLDIILSLLMGLVSLPVIILAAIAVRLDSRGPIFYLQNRIGEAGRKIRIIKFRTMIPDADAVLGAYLDTNPDIRRDWELRQKLSSDPRITRPGKWLRRYSIDELPQLLNVLRGDMSLVGPRPIMENQVRQYGDMIATYYSVRPGLTGLWQVSGRNLISFEERARYDLHYVRNWSIWLDIYILARTVWVVFSREGAF